MKKSRLSDEQIHGAVRQMEADRTADEMSRELGVSKATLYGIPLESQVRRFEIERGQKAA